MSKLDLAIRGGTVVTASDTFRADVGVREGRIVAVAAEIEEATREIDASGLLVLPGGIDSHVHIAQPSGPNVVMADDFASATAAAAAGGNTCIMPVALQQRGMSLRRCVEDYVRQAEGECHIDVSVHLIITDPTPEVLGQELPALLKAGYTSFKVFMTYDDLVLNDRQLLEEFADGDETAFTALVDSLWISSTSSYPARAPVCDSQPKAKPDGPSPTV